MKWMKALLVAGVLSGGAAEAQGQNYPNVEGTGTVALCHYKFKGEYNAMTGMWYLVGTGPCGTITYYSHLPPNGWGWGVAPDLPEDGTVQIDVHDPEGNLVNEEDRPASVGEYLDAAEQVLAGCSCTEQGGE